MGPVFRESNQTKAIASKTVKNGVPNVNVTGRRDLREKNLQVDSGPPWTTKSPCRMFIPQGLQLQSIFNNG
jgi:hypothetical protein